MQKLKLYTVTVLCLFAFVAFGQNNFEGKIIYKNEFKSKSPKVSDQQLDQMMGTTEEYLVKNGNYKNSSNGTFMQWQIYVNKDNKLYNKIATSEALLWNDALTRDDSMISVKINRGATTILGYKCDELVMVTKKGTQRYYFSSQLAMDPTLYKNHNLGCWYDYLKASKALPLKMIQEGDEFTLTSTATEVKPMKVDDKDLTLPDGAKTMKSPY